LIHCDKLKKWFVTLHSAMGCDTTEQAAVVRHQEPEFHEIKKLVEYGTMGDNSLQV
jgi:hypothetical protein